MSMLFVENLVKTYGDKTLFDHISFTIEENQRVGLIGVNGTGKSTLLKVLAGLDSAENGNITHSNNFTIEYLSQNPEFNEGLTVLDQIYYGDSKLMRTMREYEKAISELEINPEDEKKQEKLLEVQQKMDEQNAWEANTTAKMILTKLGVSNFFQDITHLSGGQKKRVAIAKSLIQPADLLILDEPTNHLDNEMIEWLEGYLSQYKGAILLVTHDRYFLNRVTNRIFELDQGQLYSYAGNYELFLEKKAERMEQEAANERKHQNILRRELAWLRRGAKARTTKQKARVDRAHELQDKKFNTQNENVEISIGSNRLGKQVIELEGITKSFEDKTVIKDFDYLVVPGERLGIIGPNGSGKSTLLNIMAGRIEPDKGSMVVGETVKIGYYTQENVEMNQELRVIDYIKETAEVVKTVDGQVISAVQMLERFLFSRDAQWNYIRKLSGGERRRLYLLKVLMEEPNVLFLDEPTNDLDTETLSILEDYLEQFPGVVITVSHDRYFLDRVVDHLITFDGKGNIDRFHGTYSEFLEEQKQKQNHSVETKLEQSKNEEQPPKEKRKKLSYNEQREWETIEQKITQLEQRQKEIEVEIEQTGNDLGKAQELFNEQQQTADQLEQVIERWTELSLLIEELEGK